MAYIGASPQTSLQQYLTIDDISGSFNGVLTSFALQVGGVAPVPGPSQSNQLLISLGGVIQEPDDTGSAGFRLSGGNIIFSSAPASSTAFFGVVLAGADYIYAGTNFPDGSVSTPSITFANDLDSGFYRTGSGELAYTSNGTFRLKIDSSGRVGIGTSSPASKLHLNESTSAGTFLRVQNAAGSAYYGVDGSGDAYAGSISADNFKLYTNASPRLTIDSSGRVGIGTSSVSANLHVAKNTNGNIASFRLSGNDGSGDGGAGIQFADNETVKWSLFTRRYSSANKFYISTGENDANSSKLTITEGGLVGIGTTSPGDFDSAANQLVIQNSGSCGITIDATSSTDSNIYFADGPTGSERYRGVITYSHSVDALRFGTNGGTERARIDSSGRLLIGTTSSRNVWSAEGQFQIEAANNARNLTIVNNAANTNGATITLGKSRSGSVGGNTSVNNGDSLGAIGFAGADGTDLDCIGAYILSSIDAAPSSNSMPGRLVFATTASGDVTSTERMRIDSNGRVSIAHDGSYYAAGETLSISASDNGNVHVGRATNASFSNNLMYYYASRAQNSAYTFLRCASNAGGDTEFNLRGDGNAYADGSWNGGGADYAEFFEWSDGNTIAEDRRGISVVLDGDKIREAVAGEEPIGVISGNPSVVGDADIDRWKGKHLRDDFGTYIQEEHNVVEWTDQEGKKHNYEDWNIPADVVVPDDAVVTTHDSNGKRFSHRALNPAYDPDQKYVSREDRPEWDCVGLMGKLRIRKGQVTGARWIKMRDISDNVEEWLVR